MKKLFIILVVLINFSAYAAEPSAASSSEAKINHATVLQNYTQHVGKMFAQAQRKNYMPNVLTSKILSHLYGNTIFRFIGTRESLGLQDNVELASLPGGNLWNKYKEAFDSNRGKYEVQRYAWAPDYSKLAVAYGGKNPFYGAIAIWSYTDQLNKIAEINVGEHSSINSFAWLPDSQKIAFSKSVLEDEKINFTINIFDIEHNTTTSIASLGSQSFRLGWSKNNMLAVSPAPNNSSPEIKIFDINNRSLVKTIDRFGATEMFNWSNDGSKLALNDRNRRNKINCLEIEIFDLHSDIEEPILKTELPLTGSSSDWFPEWSKDDRFIALHSPTNKIRIIIMDAQTGKIMNDIETTGYSKYGIQLAWTKLGNANALGVYDSEMHEVKVYKQFNIVQS